MPGRQSLSVRFGPFEATLAARELRKNGVRVKLQDQPFRVLQMLLEKPGEVVTREQLQERIWGEDTYVDFDKSLSAAVGKVREALDDSRSRPLYIETIPKVGYRFIGEIDAGVPEPPGKAPSGSSPWRRWALAGGLAAALLAWSYIPRPEPREPIVPLSAVPLTAYEGVEDHPTFSPDGSQLAFAWDKNEGGGSEIYVRGIGSEQPRRLTDSEGLATSPAWSPDGESIAYLAGARENGRCELRLISPTGGASQTAASFTCPGQNFYSSLAWSPDGQVVVYPDKLSVSEPWALYAVDVATRETWSVSDPPTGVVGDASPSFSRSGERLAFLRRRSAYNATEIRTIGLDPDFKPASPSAALALRGSEPLQRANSVVWSRDDNALFASNGGALWRIHSRGSDAKKILSLGGWLNKAASLDLNNNRLALVQHELDQDIWRLDREKGDARPLITSTQLDYYHSVSPDGTRIAWTSARSGSLEVWVCNADGSNRQQLTRLESQSGSPTWSPDGDWIIFDTRVNGNTDLYIVDSRGGPARPFLTGPEDDLQPSWSADGNTLYFTSLRGGAFGIWRVGIEKPAMKPLEIEPVTPAASGAWVKVSPDGRFLYYCGGDVNDPEDRHRLYRKRLPDGEEVPLADNVGGFDAAGNAVYYLSSDKSAIWRLDSGSGESQLLLELEEEGGDSLAVSRDERTILFTQAKPQQADLMLVDGIE